MSLQGKVALVTGASSGIGRAIAANTAAVAAAGVAGIEEAALAGFFCDIVYKGFYMAS